MNDATGMREETGLILPCARPERADALRCGEASPPPRNPNAFPAGRTLARPRAGTRIN
jgi:hypothetical protein